MKQSAPPSFLRFTLVSLLLLLFWLVSALTVASYESFTVLSYPENSTIYLVKPEANVLTKNRTLAGEFVARENNLGIVTIKLTSIGHVGDEDVLVFRIKENTSADWLYTNEYKGGMFRGSKIFTFGFPIITEAKGKTYHFELTSLHGTEINALRISDQNPVFTSRYKFSKNDLFNPNFLGHFLRAKVYTLFINPDIMSSTLIFIMPLMLYWLSLLYMTRRISLFVRHRYLAVSIVLLIFYDILFSRLHWDIVFFTILSFWCYTLYVNKMSYMISFHLAFLIIAMSIVLTSFSIPFSINTASAWVYFLMLIGLIQSVGKESVLIHRIIVRLSIIMDYPERLCSRVYAFVKRNMLPFAAICFVGFVYRRWFMAGQLTAPDFPYYFPQRFSELFRMPIAWTNLGATSLGEPSFAGLGLGTYVYMVIKLAVSLLHIPWDIASRLLFFWPFLVVGIASVMYTGYAILQNRMFVAFAATVYMTNSYALMITGGGQVGIFMAYAAAPLILGSFIRRNRALFTLAVTLILLFDLRISLLAFFILFLYVVCVVPVKKWMEVVRFGILPVIISLGLHSFWLLPVIAARGITLPGDFADPKWLSFLSWAEFSKTVSLLHPNWPENIFGKTYFTRPEFLLLPIAAYGSWLLFTKYASKVIKSNAAGIFKTFRTFIFLSLLGLLGAYLSKGVNPPFGELYRWMFAHVPFFTAFREPTKFYLFTALSYSMLVPFGFLLLSEWMSDKVSRKYHRMVTPIVSCVFIGMWLVTLMPVFQGKLTGSFARVEAPKTYERLAALITTNPQFTRTLAVPWRNRFIYESENHPVVSASDLFHTTDISRLAEILQTASAAAVLEQFVVKNAVIPDDFMHEIFMTDRKYDPSRKQQLVSALDNQPYFTRDDIDGTDIFTALAESGVFSGSHDDETILFPYSMHTPAKYTVSVPKYNTSRELVFAQAYHPGWRMWDGQNALRSEKTPDGLNSFRIATQSPITADIYFEPQRYVDIGMKVSLVVIGIIIMVVTAGVLIRIVPAKIVAGALVITFGVSVYALSVGYLFAREVISNKHIRWSGEWQTITNPTNGRIEKMSTYGGSEFRFVVGGTSAADITVADFWPEQNNAIEIWVNGKEITVPAVSPISEQVIRIDPPASLYEVRVRIYCSGDAFCRSRIRSIKLHRGGVMLPVQNPPLTRVAILGDSVASQYGADNYLYEVADRKGWQLHNASYTGSTLTAEPGVIPGILRIQKDIVSFAPDIIILALGTNDAIRQVPIDIFKRDYNLAVSEMSEKLPKAKIYTLGVLPDFSGAIVNEEGYNDAIMNISRQYDATYIPMTASTQRNHFADTIHPSLDAQKIMADYVMKYIE